MRSTLSCAYATFDDLKELIGKNVVQQNARLPMSSMHAGYQAR